MQMYNFDKIGINIKQFFQIPNVNFLMF